MWLDKLKEEWYSYWIMKYIVKKARLNKKIHKLIYKRFGWDEEVSLSERLWDFSRDF